MQTITIKKKQNDGSFIQATFATDRGMNLISLKKGSVELIDQSTKQLFEERFAGLGALIGPHFYHRKAEALPPPCPHDLFPHIAKVLAKGQKEFFSHGIGRYVPWQVVATEEKIQGKISSVDRYKDYTLEEIEGLNFVMQYEAILLEDRMRIVISSNSDTASCVGLHYYFAMGKAASVNAAISPFCYFQGEKKELPNSWLKTNNFLSLPIDQELDYGFLPKLENGLATIVLKTEDYSLKMEVTPLDGSQLSFQVYHPNNGSFVCVEPISAENPRGEIPKKGSLQIDFIVVLTPDQSG